MRKLTTTKKPKGSSSASSSPRYSSLLDCNSDIECRARKGFVPVVAGGDGGVRERFLIPTRFMAHPSIVSLLELSADEYGYEQEGVIRIPCEPDCFREIINSLPSKKR